MTFTDHAQKRLQQRGFKYEHIDFIINYGNFFKKPGGTIEVKLSKRSIKEILSKKNKMKVQMFDKIKNKAILLSEDDDCVITMYNLY